VDESSIINYKIKYKIFKIQFGKKLQFSTGLLLYLLKNTNSNSVLHFNEIWNFSALIPYVIAKYKKIPYVVSTRGVLSDACLQSSSLRKKIANVLFVRRMLTGANAIHVTSEDELSRVKQLINNNNVYNIPNIADTNSVYKVTRDEATKELCIDGDKRYISTMARQIQHKGSHKIIKAMAHRDCDWTLLIGGPLVDDKYYEYLLLLAKKYNISDKVIFLDQLDNYKKSCLFKVSEYFVLLSDSENFGMVILESLMHSTPVITTKNTPWKQLVKCKAGWWVDDNDKSISNAIVDAYQTNNIMHHNMKKNSHLLYEKYSGKSILKKYKKMYNSIYSNYQKNIGESE
jgi:glycosyltransferase involved in cell wall biosynthesis